jgi:hypothetical protein
MTENEVYQFYNKTVKVLYADIEATNNFLPIELLFEIHAAFDHLKRYHVDGESEEKCADKAFSHLKRGALDAFKLKLKYHNVSYEKLMGHKADLKIIDNGSFLPKLLNDRKHIIQKATEARLREGNPKTEDAFEAWVEAYDLINTFEKDYFDPTKTQWARRQGYFRFGITAAVSFVIGLASGYLAGKIDGVIEFIHSLFIFS